MTDNQHPRAGLIGLICGVVALGAAPMPGFAQDKAPQQQTAPPAPGPAEAPQFKEIALTQAQIEGVLGAQKELDDIVAKMSQSDNAVADPKITSQFEDVVKKHGFANYAAYNDAVETISFVLGGFDPATKTYVGPEAVLKQQIAAVEADKTLPAADKKAALDELNTMAKSPPPAIEIKANIDLVGRYYDRLAAALAQDDE